MSMGAKKHSRKKNIENVSMFKEIKIIETFLILSFYSAFYFCPELHLHYLRRFFRIGQKFITTVIITNSSYIFLISKTKKICR